jgi:hypothetical protein
MSGKSSPLVLYREKAPSDPWELDCGTATVGEGGQTTVLLCSECYAHLSKVPKTRLAKTM